MKQAFDNVSPLNLSLVNEGNEHCSEIGWSDFEEADLRQVMTITSKRDNLGHSFDKSIKQGGKESPCLFNLVMKSIFKTLQEKWQEVQMEIRTQRNRHQHERYRITRMIFAHNCYIFSEKKEQMINTIEDATFVLEKKGLEWKEDQIELISLVAE